MRLRGERGAARSRALVESFRPRIGAGAPRVVLTGFGSFPGVSRNATAEMIHAIAASANITMARPSFRAPELETGRGRITLSSGREIDLSLMVLPVLWDGAAALVAKEARATRASLVIMSGIAGKLSAITIERFATTARRTLKDAFGVRPVRNRGASSACGTAFDTECALAAAREAIAKEAILATANVVCRELDATNSYVCNATAHVTARLASRGARVLRSAGAPEGIAIARLRAAHGFVHWPGELRSEQAPACGNVLLAMVSALVSEERRAAGAA
jgi:pyrrolidone-carboxylate peptidase